MEGSASGVDWDWIRVDFSVREESWGRSFVWGEGGQMHQKIKNENFMSKCVGEDFSPPPVLLAYHLFIYFSPSESPFGN